MTSVESSNWLSYNPVKVGEIDQMLSNGVVWSVIPAGLELFVESDGGLFVLTTFALGVFEQFVENRITVAQPVVRRFVPLATTTAVMGGFLLAISRGDPRFYADVAAITSISSLTLASIKSVTNKPYPSIMPLARKMATLLPVVGSWFKEKEKLF